MIYIVRRWHQPLRCWYPWVLFSLLLKDLKSFVFLLLLMAFHCCCYYHFNQPLLAFVSRCSFDRFLIDCEKKLVISAICVQLRNHYRELISCEYASGYLKNYCEDKCLAISQTSIEKLITLTVWSNTVGSLERFCSLFSPVAYISSDMILYYHVMFTTFNISGHVNHVVLFQWRHLE